MKDRQRWQPEEDALLRSYVRQYGPKEWSLLSQRMGKHLDRDPKSCLERWKNYLKPGIKKGSLTPEEQTLVISLQAKYGNKWKKIASEVPGRTAKRLGKWWEVFKEKQLKQLEKRQQRPDCTDPPAVAAVPGTGSPETAVQGKYDHILETFAEKYVQPRVLAFQSLPLAVMPNISLPQAPPVLSLGPVAGPESAPVLPAWMNPSANMGSATSSLTSSSSSTPSPSVSLTLSPSEPVVLDPAHSETCFSTRFLPVQQVGTLVQYCKEVEEGRQNWMQQKKEAAWRLNRLEQQLESEKGRKRREKMEEIEGKIRCLREEEVAFLGRVESEYREQLNALQRDADSKEAKIMEAWSSEQGKLAKLVEQIGIQSHAYSQI